MRTKKLRRKPPKQVRTLLETDELADLLAAAEAIEREGRARSSRRGNPPDV